MKECECCKAKREERELRTKLSKLLKRAADCDYKNYNLRTEYFEALLDHGIGLIFNIFYPKEAE